MIRLSGEYIREDESDWDYICRLINESSKYHSLEDKE